MPSTYPQRALTVLLLFGTLAAAMALLASSLIFQLPSGRSGPGAGAGAVRGALPESVAAVLLPVSAVLASLCLVLNLSCLLLCLLHGYFSTELCRGQRGPERAAWFLLDSRRVRHAAIALFCCGVSVYLAALAISMLLLFELEGGIASACILSSGVLVLLITVTHALIRASQVSHHIPSEISHTLYENNSAQPPESSTSDLNNKNLTAAPASSAEFHREFSFPLFPGGKSPASSHLTSSASPGIPSEQESSNLSRTHRTLESGLLQAQGKPWNGIRQEMRNVLARKPGASGKDSTLV
ncbi:transmembrane protein 221 [Calypte anna]|uniref:transmembrane protein 221 n=1 Tax=Calypte anna TaxID=9244 RepID=UPI0011C38B25|nr:transmembrane protein 221 [Calypte anna]